MWGGECVRVCAFTRLSHSYIIINITFDGSPKIKLNPIRPNKNDKSVKWITDYFNSNQNITNTNTTNTMCDNAKIDQNSQTTNQ